MIRRACLPCLSSALLLFFSATHAQEVVVNEGILRAEALRALTDVSHGISGVFDCMFLVIRKLRQTQTA